MSPLPIDCDVLLAAYGGGHVTMLEPVARQLREHENLSIGFLALTTAQAYLKSRDVPFFGYADLDQAGDAEVIAYGKKLAGDVSGTGPVSAEETIAYHGLNFKDLVATHGIAAAEKKYQELGRHAFLPTELMCTLLKQIKPKVVVATNSPRSEQALLLAARKFDIPRLCLVDLFGSEELRWISTANYADRICVLNDDVRRSFVDAGCDAGATVVTGNPAFDAINTPANIAAGAAWRNARGIGDGERIILWASQIEPEIHPFSGARGRPELPSEVEAELRRIVARHDGWRLVVRHHPSEQRKFVPADRVHFSPQDEPLHPLLHASDAVVIISSTVGLEAALSGASVFSIDLSVCTPLAPYSKFGLTTGVTDLQQLEPLLATALVERRAPPTATASSACDYVCSEIKTLLQRNL